MNTIPVTNGGFDLYSKLLKDRIIMIDGEINTVSASLVTAQLLYLDSESSEDIEVIINSPGGSISDGLLIIDTMKRLRSDVRTVAGGICASMGSLIAAAGTKGKRYVYPHAEIMVHSPATAMQGNFASLQNSFSHLERIKKTVYSLYADYTGKSYEEIEQAASFDNYMTPQQAIEFGLADHIL